MSRYGDITVDVFASYSKESLKKFAKAKGITFEQAVSLAKETLYRKQYMALRRQDPAVKARRKAYNQKRYELRKSLSE